MAGGIGGLLNLRENSEDYNYLYDGKGNVMAVVKAGDESMAASYRYDIFGKPLKKTGTFDQPYRFSTKRYDEQTALSHYEYRFYNSAIGRWMNRDPLGETGGINLYGFVNNNPINFIDPNGLEMRVYSSDAFGISGLNHAFVWSTETGRGKGTNGSLWVTQDNGVGDLSSPYSIATLPPGMSEQEFMKRINEAKGWNNWIWTPWVNDCHSDLESAFKQAGVTYPGAPNGRMDIDDNIRSLYNSIVRTLNQLNNPKYVYRLFGGY